MHEDVHNKRGARYRDRGRDGDRIRHRDRVRILRSGCSLCRRCLSEPGSELNSAVLFSCLVFCCVLCVLLVFGGPGSGFGGFRVGSKSSCKATTATTKKKASEDATRTTQSQQKRNKNKQKTKTHCLARTLVWTCLSRS